mgnify:CR=1 FL=1
MAEPLTSETDLGAIRAAFGCGAALAGTPADYDFNHRWFVFFGLAWSALLLAVLHGPRWLRRPAVPASPPPAERRAR